MRRALIILVAGAAQEVISGPAVPYDEQKRRFKELKGEHPEGFERAELWESSRGLTKRISFKDYVAGTVGDFNEAETGASDFSEDAVYDFTDEEKELVNLFRESKVSLEELRIILSFDAANTLSATMREIPEGEESPSACEATDASGQAVTPPPADGVVIQTEAQIIGGGVALVEVPETAPSSETLAPPGSETLPLDVVEGDDSGPTLGDSDTTPADKNAKKSQSKTHKK